jgi:hypothetical protein
MTWVSAGWLAWNSETPAERRKRLVLLTRLEACVSIEMGPPLDKGKDGWIKYQMYEQQAEYVLGMDGKDMDCTTL